ncbi:uncharacterized protein BX664DRAFT_320043 [Halteromyces radiatus]|uniref:uncharacterized protein n=1 Tax=Halteromyces radiatus TaxID=101107 RepID=UPI002220541E|nr:uncharacterized protein BX664DRAFT_320043 [Halteromyces radiatus]KAI8098966.1 hypothetical protein BX664DRAFT_320043 [Halteromyces radiatus]
MYYILIYILGMSVEDVWSLLNSRTKEVDTIEDLWKVLIQHSDLIIQTRDEPLSTPKPIASNQLETYQQTKSKYGSLIVTANSTLQNEILLQGLHITLPAIQRTILERIGSSGPSGIAQCVIAKDLELKPQTIFHHLKKLQERKLIIKTPSIYQGQYTNTCVHIYHSKHGKNDDDTMATGTNILDNKTQSSHMIGPDDDSIRYDMAAETINYHLSQAKDNIMVLSDLLQAAGFKTEKQLKWARNFLAKKHTEGYVEKLLSTANGRRTMCVRLIKPILINEDKSEITTRDDDEILDPTTTGTKQKEMEPLTMDTVESCIIAKQGQGCTTKDIYLAFPDRPKSTIHTVIKKLRDKAKSRLIAIKELQGRSHVYRYFSQDGYKQYQATKDGHAVLPTSMSFSSEKSEQSSIDDSYTSIHAKGTKRKTSSTSSLLDSTIPKRKRSTGIITDDTIKDDNKTNPTLQSNVNVTMERRRNALLSIVQRDRIRELNQHLIDEIQSVDGSNGNHRLSKKSVLRIVNALELQGLLRMIKVTPKGLFAGNQPKSLLLSHELTETDQAINTYLESQLNNTNKILPTPRTTTTTTKEQKPLKTVTTTIERYGERRNYCPISSEYFWRYIAKRHGWVDSKWLRAKELHLFLAKSHLQSLDGASIDSENQTMTLSKIITTMPFELFRKVVGIHHHDPIVESFVEANGDRDSTLCLGDIPDSIKHHLIPDRYRLRRRIQALLTILEKLDLVRLSTCDESLGNTTASTTPINLCTFQLVGYIRNYSLPNRPILVKKPLTTMEQVDDFWNELQYTCTCVYGSDVPQSIKKGGDLLSSITLSRTWVNGDLITPKQKRILDQHVNYSLGKIPPNEWSLYLQLSRETGLLPYRIRSYYINLGIAFTRWKKSGHQRDLSTASSSALSTVVTQGNSDQIQQSSIKQYNRKRKRLLDSTAQKRLQASEEHRKISRATDQKRQSTELFSVPTSVGSRSLRRKPIKGVDDSILTRDQRNNGKRTIQRFSASEKSIFLHAVAIMRHRANGSYLSWKPIVQVLPNKTIGQCISHMNSLIAISSPSLCTLNSLEYKWASIYRRGIQCKDIVDEKPWDTKDFDLAGYLEYFLTQLISWGKDSIQDLPKNVDNLHDLYTITSQEVPIGRLSWMRKTNLVNNTLGNVSINTHGYPNKDIFIAIQLIKMIMIHPEESFSPHAAYNLLCQCSEKDVEAAYAYLRDNGAVVLSKHGDTRRVPGRQFRMSNKFVMAMNGPVSIELYNNASDFHQQIMDDQPVPKDLTDGMMVSLLNLLSQRKIVLENHAFQSYMKHVSSRLVFPLPIRKHDRRVEQWTNKHIDLRIRLNDRKKSMTLNTTTTTIDAMTAVQRPTGQTKETVKKLTRKEAHKYLTKQPLKSFRHAKTLYDGLDKFGVCGATSMDLKLKLQTVCGSLDDKDLLLTLDKLMHHDPPLVTKIGQEDLRWICTEYIDGWMIKLKAMDTASSNEEYLRMNIWCDLNGNTNHAILQACECALVGHILQKPGITLDVLEYLVRETMSKAECRQILDLLLEKDVITCRTTIKQEPATLFSTPLFKSIDPKITIAPSTTSHYFTKHDYYIKLTVIKR